MRYRRGGGYVVLEEAGVQVVYLQNVAVGAGEERGSGGRDGKPLGHGGGRGVLHTSAGTGVGGGKGKKVRVA